MQRKVIFLPVFIGAILCGCSSDSSDKNPVDTATLPTIGEGDDQGNPLTGFDPNTPYIDPVSGDTLPVIEYTDPSTGETVPAVQYVDSETGDTITVPITLPASSGSTAIAPASSATAQAPTHLRHHTGSIHDNVLLGSTVGIFFERTQGIRRQPQSQVDIPPESRFLF